MVGGYLGSRRVMPAIGEPGHRLRGAGIGTARVGGGGGGGLVEGAFALERVELETERVFVPEGATSEELQTEKRLCKSRKRMSREKTHPTTRVSRS